MADTDAQPVDEDTLVADIDRTRTELARTIDAIADRVSPKKNVARTMEQVRRRADHAMEQIRRGAGQVDPLVAGAAAAAVAVSITALILWRRSRR
jgi:methyl-accepting chemotaxis protein